MKVSRSTTEALLDAVILSTFISLPVTALVTLCAAQIEELIGF